MVIFRGRPARLAAAALLALGFTAAAQAAEVSFLLTGQGFAVATPCDTANCMQGFTAGSADDTAFPGTVPGDWFTSLTFSVATDTGTGSGTWQFTDNGPATTNDLFGTFVAQVGAAGPGAPYSATIGYTVTGGDGMFAGATGSGTSTMYLDGDLNYGESGAFHVTTPVPEPSSIVLLLSGLALIGVVGSRRIGR